ncbi:MAG: tetratricopeptide repeat protein [Anaerolineales bacterium]|uniref:tetratricopeptide repeat protein n=1 Tax=Candidatus Villigracilis vicinus TaxID=3140679 RepID=UPI0031354DB7|nr:tetratricopeptide repeat protein [Anaerolineales bacterium]
MKKHRTTIRTGLRLLLELWLIASLTACSVLENFPAIPPGWTVTPSITTTPEATFTPTITPTPQPVARVSEGEKAFFNGDYDTALLHYQIALQDSPDPLVRASAKWGEARIYYAQGRYNETLTALQVIITEYSQSPQLPLAYFLQGFVNYKLENYPAAADSWQTYLVLRPGVLDAYVQELRGDALFNARDYPGALASYSTAITADSLSDDTTLDLKVASTQTQLGNYETALELYDGIIGRTTSDYTKAQALYEAGLTNLAQGQNAEAIERFRFAVENYPLSYYSYLSLVALLDAGGTVNELDRGLVDFFAGQYAVAISAFDRYLQSNPAENDGTAYYYRALSKNNMALYDEALVDYGTFISNYSAHPLWTDAWGEKAFIEWAQQGNYTKGAETLLEFVNLAPTSSQAADYLMSAARIYERDAQYDKAIEAWSRVTLEYPGSQQSSYASFLMGIVEYRRENSQAALDAFKRSLAMSVSEEDKSRALLWIGKAYQKLGDGNAATDAWREGQNINPGGYYSERARDLLQERAAFASSSSANYQVDILKERTDADTWMRLTFNLSNEIDLSNLGPLALDARIIRGKEYWEMGMLDEARLEFEDLRTELETNKDAVGSYRLANYLVELGMYRTAIFAARQVLSIAGLDEHTESMMAPAYFSHIRYGLYYSDLITPAAQAEGFDPLFVYSVIRQESLFEGFVRSSAGAHGLMQIIAPTGAQIASELGKPINYTEEDLYRPYVSVLFGTHYLARNRTLLNGDLYATLAAYNGGPGNAVSWKELSGDDPDLFLESVRFEETRNYIRNIYEIFTVYRRLYGGATGQ